jgi:hypothetical protein
MIEKKLENLKQDFDSYIGDRKIFTERDKKNIRVKLLEGRFQKKRTIKFVPILATCAAGLLFLVLLNAFASEKIGSLFNSDDSQQVAMDSDDVEKQNGKPAARKPTRFVIDPMTVKVDDQVNNFQVKFVTENGDKEQILNSHFGVVMEGEAMLTGSFEIMSVEDVEQLFFVADESSLLRLPIVAGLERGPHLKILNDNKKMIDHLQIKPGEKKKAQILIDLFTITHNSYIASVQYDSTRLKEIDGVFVGEENPETQVREYHIATEKIIPTYQKLVTTRKDADLQGLKPFEVFQLYWQAFEFGNLEIKHFLFGGSDVPDLQTYTEQVLEKNQPTEQLLYEKIRKKGLESLVIHEELNSAYVDIEGEKFHLIKMDTGVWKVRYLPTGIDGGTSFNQNENTGVMNEIPISNDFLPERLIPIIEKLSSDHEDIHLKGLDPADVFLLYWQAFDLGNLELKYALFTGEGMPEYQYYVDRVNESTIKQEQRIYEIIKQKGAGIFKPVIKGNEAYIKIDESTQFHLVKNERGIWKVNYLPY